MELSNLKEKSILIGKEPGQGRLCISVMANGKQESAMIGAPGSVPNSVSRCKPTEGTAHCKIDVDKSGNMVLVNLKPQNVTFVDGIEIESKKIDSSSTISLGKDKFSLDLDKILQVALKLSEHIAPTSCSIKHLEDVWNEYESTMEAIQYSQQKYAKRRTLPIIISMVLSALVAILASIDIKSLYISIPVAIITISAYIIIYWKKDTSIEDRKEANNYLIDNYQCPNCHHYMGAQPYKILKQNKKCPYCGCHFVS